MNLSFSIGAILFFSLAGCSGHVESDSEAVDTGESKRLDPVEFEALAKSSTEDITGVDAFLIYEHLSNGWSSGYLKNKDPNFWLELAIEKRYWPAAQNKIAPLLAQRTHSSCAQALATLDEFSEDEGKQSLIANLYDEDLRECVDLVGKD